MAECKHTALCVLWSGEVVKGIQPSPTGCYRLQRGLGLRQEERDPLSNPQGFHRNFSDPGSRVHLIRRHVQQVLEEGEGEPA